MYVSGGMPNWPVFVSDEIDLIVTSLKVGYNTVSVTDAGVVSLRIVVRINENPLIESTVSVVQNVSCYGKF